MIGSFLNAGGFIDCDGAVFGNQLCIHEQQEKVIWIQ
jgi:hypothetical protein